MNASQFPPMECTWNLSSVLQKKNEWLVELNAGIELEIRQAFQILKKRAMSTGGHDESDFSVPKILDLLTGISLRLENGLGFVILRGFPIHEFSLLEVKALFWWFCRFLGKPIPQNNNGDLMVHVEDVGIGQEAALARGHQSREMLPFHCDRCDVIALLCVRSAKIGGLSSMVSAAMVHNQFLEKFPDLIADLYSDFPHDLRGSEQPGNPPWAEIPIFNRNDNVFVSRYVRKFIESSQRFPDAPRITPNQRRVLDGIDEILSNSENTLSYNLTPGDIQLINNYTVWHSRSAFVDWENPNQKRLLLRLWLSAENSRRLPESYKPLYGSIESGAVRGGFPIHSA